MEYLSSCDPPCLHSFSLLPWAKQNYNGIDRILKGLLSCYETPYQDLDPSQVVAQALCNLRWACTLCVCGLVVVGG